MSAPAQFQNSLSNERPPDDLSAPLLALWWAHQGDWGRAHKIVMDDDSKEAALVHAYLHRVEGDLPNARYWYRRAGQKPERGALEAEWADLVKLFMTRGSSL